MLPEALVSVYQSYKTDTDFITTWLATTARAYGCPAELISGLRDSKDDKFDSAPEDDKPTGQRKGKSTKEASKSSQKKPRKRYILAVKDLLPLAQFLATSQKPAIAPPDSLTAALDRVIDLRAKFSTQLVEHGATTNAQDDSTHFYFLRVLCQVRHVLTAHRTASPTNTAASTGDAAEKAQPSANKFEGLLVSEPSAQFINAPDAPPPTRPAKSETDANFEAESEMSSWDAQFVWQLVWKDLHGMRQRVRYMWQQFREGRHELVSVALATNTAIDLARNIVEDVTPVLQSQPGGLFGVICLYNATFTTTKIRKYSEGLLRFPEKPTKEEIAYVAGVLDCTNAYSMLQQLLPKDQGPINPPLVTKGSPKIRLARTHGDFVIDRNAVSGVLYDMYFITRYIPDWPVDDGVLRGFRETLRTREIPFYFAYAVQLLIDIHGVMGQNLPSIRVQFMRGLSTLQELMTQAWYIHQSTRMDPKALRCFPLLQQTVMSMSKMTRDPILVEKQRLKKPIADPSLERLRLMKTDPVMAGLVMYTFRAATYRVGICLANDTLSVMSTMHLYNALYQEGLLKSKWWDIELIKELAGKSQFYVGNPPSDPTGYIKSFLMQTGLKSVYMSQLKRSKTQTKLYKELKNRRRISEGATVSMMFYERYCNEKGETSTGNFTAEDIVRILDHCPEGLWFDHPQEEPESESQDKGSKKSTQKRKKPAKPVKPSLPPYDIITSLGVGLLDEAAEFGFPWLAMHRNAWHLMRKIRMASERTFMMLVPGYSMSEAGLMTLTTYILDVLVHARPNNSLGKRVTEEVAATFNHYLTHVPKDHGWSAGETVWREMEIALGVGLHMYERVVGKVTQGGESEEAPPPEIVTDTAVPVC
ncbi:hypothetical protein HER10_EVM0009527 [Colletotrichum scovillei]|uniref:Ank-repeat protein mbp1 n=1 Tax=Colletotrichum scovillei TaxID=1209932 RepID=A0A9P7R132_9PEZI|nr:uncharacterized protein HER10_EVM0009527 [Colletotrichum scovillei]KAF4773296.1 hypothetical protein HER10_EVM0009527 [Colletotrichum scovillei]KAG7046558.1 ank-repeat protein mbp1 [Colletotrichum scovillei]KAG7056398.1 ank-repeat protein mbp1 [Colletotrichum scovillei]